MTTYRLLKVICQAVLISVDDEDNLIEHQSEPTSISAKDFPEFPNKLAAQIASLNEKEALRVLSEH